MSLDAEISNLRRKLAQSGQQVSVIPNDVAQAIARHLTARILEERDWKPIAELVAALDAGSEPDASTLVKRFAEAERTMIRDPRRADVAWLLGSCIRSAEKLLAVGWIPQPGTVARHVLESLEARKNDTCANENTWRCAGIVSEWRCETHRK